MTDPIDRWLEQVHSDNSKMQYRRNIRTFCKWGNTNLEALLKQRAQETASLDPNEKYKTHDLLMEFWQKGPGKPSTKAHIISTMKSFFKANEMPLGMKTPRWEKARDKDYIPSREDIQKMVSASTPRNSALILTQAETGLRIGALASLKLKHILGDITPPSFGQTRNPSKIDIPDAITQPGCTFIYADAAHYLRRWLIGRKISAEDPIFGISGKQAILIIRNAAYEAKIVDSKTGISNFRPHCFRKRVQTILETTFIDIPEFGLKGTVPLNWVDLLLDHIPRGSQGRAYSRPSVDALRQVFIGAEKRLRVF